MSLQSAQRWRRSKVGMMSSRSTERRILLLAGAAISVAVALVAFASDEVSARAVGWFFGGPVATTFVAMNRSAFTRWSAQTGRVPPRWQILVSVFLVAL